MATFDQGKVVLSHGILVVLVILAFLVGADRLTLGAGGIARKLRVPPFLVGLTVAAAASAIPELILAIGAAVRGSTVLSVNLLVGTNTANIGFVLGVAYFFTNMKTLSEHVVRMALLLAGITGLVFSLFLDTYLSRMDGLVLAIGYFITIIWAVRVERPEGPIYSTYDATHGVNITTTACVLNIVIGLSAVAIAGYAINVGTNQYGVLSADMSGIVFLPLLTCLPELYMCVLSMVRRENEFAVGIVVGSNLINVSLGLGAVAIFQPTEIPPQILSLHLFVMFAFTMVLVAILIDLGPDKKPNRKGEGTALVVAYLAYVAYTVSQGGSLAP